ncbi:MAG TPA: MFS transporter [Streptosporangiaceae bacterium]|nr:MFS transporter [Streptosporangiaceae bacterium]
MPLPEDTISAPATGTASAARRKLRLALLVIATAQLMLVLDDTIVNIALPTIQRSLHVPASHLNWVASFYALTFGGLLLAGGRAGDLFGRLRMFRAGLIVFAAASMAGGLAPDSTVLLVARVVQGIGAAIAAPAALSLVTTTFPAGPERTKALSVYGGMAGPGSVIGLLLGGTLVEYVSWRWVLFINVPIAVAVLLGSRILVAGERERGTLDLAGALAATAGIGSIVYGLTSGAASGWSDPVTLACLAGGAVALALLVAREATYRAPLVPLVVLRDRSRAGAYTVMLLLGAGMLAMFYLLTLYMQIVRGYGALHTGLAYLPVIAGTGVAVGLAPRLLMKLPARAVIAAGLILYAAAMLWGASQLTPDSGYYAVILPALLVAGAGSGLVFVAATAVAVHGVAQQDSGAGAGLLNTGMQVGASLGLSALASIASIVTRHHRAGHTMATALTDGYAWGLMVAALFFAVGAVVAVATVRTRLTADEIAGR